MWYLRSSNSARGQVLPLVAICLAVLMGFAGMAIDIGYLEYQQRQQQNATDAAALGAAQALVYSGCPNPTAAAGAAVLDAGSGGFTNGSNHVTVTPNNPPASGPFASNNCAVTVTIQTQHVANFFTRLFGYPTGLPESTTATAALEANNSGCLYLLSASLEFQLNGVSIGAPGCGVLANSSYVQTNGGTVDVGYFGYAQGYQDNATDYTGGSPMKMLPVVNPCPEIAGCAYLAANPPSTSPCQALVQVNGGSQNLTPGCYDGLQINGGSVTLAGGQYEFTGSVQQNGGSLVGSGVTLYLTGNAQVQINGGNETSLTAPTTGNTANVLLYQVPSDTQTVQFNGGDQTLSGLLYAPGATGQVNGSGGKYVVLVFATMQINGGTSLVAPQPGQSIIQEAVLVE
jgi:Flp pilus assembly protein TadG